MDPQPDPGASMTALEETVRGLGAEDLLLFRRVAADRLVHLGGCGRGEGWAGIVEVTSMGWVTDPPGAGGGAPEVRRLRFDAPRQVIGPYHADAAVVVRRADELVVLGTRHGGLRLDAPDADFLAAADEAVAAVTHVSPAKRLGDELEVLHAVQELAAIDTARPVVEVLQAVGESAAAALSCEIAVLAVAGAAPVVVGDLTLLDGSALRADALVAALRTLLLGGDLPSCSQEALDRPLPGVPGGVRSWLLVPLDERGEAGLLFVHTERVARGFTQLCQEMGLRLADAARSVIATAQSRARLVEESRALRQAVERDVLTGLGNRAAWERRLDEVTSTAVVSTPGTGEVGLGVLVCDLDELKVTNDRHGHEAGDELLRRFAQLLRDVCPTEDLVRLGGDEFAVLVRGEESAAGRCHDAVVAALAADRAEDALRVSVGWCWTAVPEELRACQRRADEAMYEAKRRSRSVPVPLPRSDGRPDDPRWLAEHLVAALEIGAVTVAYQPLVHLGTGHVVGVEALARWHHPQVGWVRPERFVAAAEQAGVIGRLDEHVLRVAAQTVAGWRRGGATLTLSVNASATRVGEPGFATRLLDVLAPTGLDPAALLLETTESVLTCGEAAAAAALTSLREAGVRLAVDDFGCGGSTLARLASLPVHQIKVDMSLLHAAVRHDTARRLLLGVVRLVDGMGLQALLEGIEDPVHLALAQETGAELGQGFLLGRPMGALELGRLLPVPTTAG